MILDVVDPEVSCTRNENYKILQGTKNHKKYITKSNIPDSFASSPAVLEFCELPSQRSRRPAADLRPNHLLRKFPSCLSRYVDRMGFSSLKNSTSGSFGSSLFGFWVDSDGDWILKKLSCNFHPQEAEEQKCISHAIFDYSFADSLTCVSFWWLDIPLEIRGLQQTEFDSDKVSFQYGQRTIRVDEKRLKTCSGGLCQRGMPETSESQMSERHAGHSPRPVQSHWWLRVNSVA